MLALRAIQHAFTGRPVIDRVSLGLEPGQTVSLVGPSGCGKTTLLQLAAGLTTPTGGEVVNSFARHVLVFQEPRLLPWRRVRENVALGLKAGGAARARRYARAEELAGELGLTDHLGHFPHELSGGLQQRVALARALAMDADCLLLDEPFSALDVGMRAEAQNLLRGLLDRHCIATLLVTHDLTEAVRLSDRIVVLSPAPARVVHDTGIERPFSRRDAAFLHETAAALLRVPAVERSFLACQSTEDTPG